ncbi:hypothetical protein RG608_10460 [Streptococcus sp. IsoGale022]|nr:hypothetical protein [Streptococcus sp. IsoGale022]MDQ8693535.1 hypothetical protein [Streptococcus sp. IsoGale022]
MDNEVDLTKLKITDLSIDWQYRRKKIIDKLKVVIVILFVIFIMLAISFHQQDSSNSKDVILYLGIIILFFGVYFVLMCLIFKFLMRKNYDFLLIVGPFIISIFTVVAVIYIFKGFQLNLIYSNVLSIIFIILFNVLNFRFFLNKNMPKAYSSIVFTNNTQLLNIISVILLFIGGSELLRIDISYLIKNQKLWQILPLYFIVCGTISFIIENIIIDYQFSKSEKFAQEIFQEQLLKNEDDINYNRLVECYYYGGEKYKEKLLSTEKF